MPPAAPADVDPALGRADPGDPRLTLTPLGPGGRPFARWRLPAVVLAAATLAVVVILLLAPRAPQVLSGVGDRVANRLQQRAPDAADVARRAASRTARRTGIEEPDTWVHIALWSASAFLLGLASWSWRSLCAVVAVLGVASVALELSQERLSPTRMTEMSDLVGNAIGLGVGLAGVVAVASLFGVPGSRPAPAIAVAPARRWARRPPGGTVEAVQRTPRYDTWNGKPCPRTVRADGTVEGSGACAGCGCCLFGLDDPWGDPPAVGVAGAEASGRDPAPPT